MQTFHAEDYIEFLRTVSTDNKVSTPVGALVPRIVMRL
jgi:hypothetical protein